MTSRGENKGNINDNRRLTHCYATHYDYFKPIHQLMSLPIQTFLVQVQRPSTVFRWIDFESLLRASLKIIKCVPKQIVTNKIVLARTKQTFEKLRCVD